MESDAPQSCEEIVQRIRHRQSVPLHAFPDLANQTRQELRDMVEDKEVLFNEAKGMQLWQLNRD
jgi:hypothetical protein